MMTGSCASSWKSPCDSCCTLPGLSEALVAILGNALTFGLKRVKESAQSCVKWPIFSLPL